MNAPSKKPQAAKPETVADELAKMDRANDNLRIWNELSKTDPSQTKGFKRAGGFSGTAIKPIWVVKRLTEQFGPCGEGWGIGEPTFQIVPGDHKEVLVYCTVACWHGTPENVVYGVGGDKVVTHIKANQQYNRPERWENDDEAFKKAFTDAVNNAFKFVGVAADIHMGLFDDSKYVKEMVAEFAPKPEPEVGTGEPASRKGAAKLDGPYDTIPKLEKAAKEFVRTLRGMGSVKEFDEWAADPEIQAFVAQCKRDLPDWWEGGPSIPAEMIPLGIEVRDTKRGLKQIEEMENQ